VRRQAGGSAVLEENVAPVRNTTIVACPVDSHKSFLFCRVYVCRYLFSMLSVFWNGGGEQFFTGVPRSAYACQKGQHKEPKMTIKVLIRRGEDGFFVANCPSLKSCWSQGKTREVALANIREAIALYLEPMPKDLPTDNSQEVVELSL